VSQSPRLKASFTVAEVATEAREVAKRIGGEMPMSDFDRERQARIIDRLAEELTEAAADLRSADS
jgi:hypothetical protein